DFSAAPARAAISLDQRIFSAWGQRERRLPRRGHSAVPAREAEAVAGRRHVDRLDGRDVQDRDRLIAGRIASITSRLNWPPTTNGPGPKGRDSALVVAFRRPLRQPPGRPPPP